MSDERPHHKWKVAKEIIQAVRVREDCLPRGATEQQLSQRPPSDAPPPRRHPAAATGSVHNYSQATSPYSPTSQRQPWPSQQLGQTTQPYPAYQSYPYGPNSPPPSAHQYSPPPQQSPISQQQYPPPLTQNYSTPPYSSTVYGQPGFYSTQAVAYPSQMGPPPRNPTSYSSPPPLQHSYSSPGNYGNPHGYQSQESDQYSQQTQHYAQGNGNSTQYASSSAETCRHGIRTAVMS
ncbi:Myeloid lymphoid or mixed-lineage leukemia 2 [Lambiella insularis]|nr:Myeloid lymphoid or mixed-lineage leukemia 2 [Lambiella insularis]